MSHATEISNKIKAKAVIVFHYINAIGYFNHSGFSGIGWTKTERYTFLL
jgi:hypothetical protein